MWWLVLACTGPGDSDTAAEVETDDTTETADTVDTVDTSLDVDDDGFAAGSDCDDYDPAVHPGAVEAWNGEDDDCDGRVDADGTVIGSLTVNGGAIVEGVRVPFAVDCPASLRRAGNNLAFEAVCEPTDADAIRLIGARLEIVNRDNVAAAGAWAGAAVFTSSDGWTADGEASARWTSFDDVTVELTLDTFSLELDGEGALHTE